MSAIPSAELTLTTFMTLDGVTQAPGGPAEDTSDGFRYGGWLVPHADEVMGATMVEIFSKAGAFLLGRRTYDIFAAHWPKVTDPRDPIAAKLNALPKYVASRTQSALAWRGCSVVRDVVREVADLKFRVSGEIQVHGSSNLAQTLLANDLIDEFRLLIFPVLLGSGRRLFNQAVVPSTWRLVSSKTTNAGAVIAVYRRAGKLTTGNVVLNEDGTYSMVGAGG